MNEEKRRSPFLWFVVVPVFLFAWAFIIKVVFFDLKKRSELSNTLLESSPPNFKPQGTWKVESHGCENSQWKDKKTEEQWLNSPVQTWYDFSKDEISQLSVYEMKDE